MNHKDIRKIFLMALSEPDYSRIDFWISQRENTYYREHTYCIKLFEAHEYYCQKIEEQEKRLKNSSDSEITDINLPLLNETDGELTGHFDKSVLENLYRSIQELVKYYGFHDDNFVNPDWQEQNKAEPVFKTQHNQFSTFTGSINSTNYFFEAVYRGELSRLDRYSYVQNVTDNFDEHKLLMLCEAFDSFFFKKRYTRKSEVTDEEVERAISNLEKDEKIPEMVDRRREGICSISEYFAEYSNNKKLNEVKKKNIIILNEGVIDVESLIYPIRFYPLYKLRRLLIELAEQYVNNNTKSDKLEFKPIKWFKSEEALRQLIESLKKNGLIQSRETDDIIQHFEVTGREAKQAKLEPINWLKSKALLAYLIEELTKQPKQSEPFIDSNKKWELVKLHFVVNSKEIARSLRGDLSQSPYPNGSDDIDTILKRLPAH